MTPIGHWTVPGYNTAGFKYDVAPMPKGPAGQATSVNSAGFVVAKASKNPDAAFAFIQFAIRMESRETNTPDSLDLVKVSRDDNLSITLRRHTVGEGATLSGHG